MVSILTALRRIGRGTLSRLFEFVFFVGLLSWDFSLSIINTFTFKRKIGQVTPKGKPGEGGIWPEYIPPREGDSRCSCPGLNAMANHGIIPRDGRNIAFKEVTGQLYDTYNFSPSFSLYTSRFIAHLLNRSYTYGHFDLADIDVHNGIEHDSSLVRRDTFHQTHQGLPDGGLVAALLKSATGPPRKGDTLPASQGHLPPNESPYFNVAAHVSKATADFDMNRTFTAADLTRRLCERRRESKASNRQYSQDTTHKMFGSSNGSTLLTIFGGRLRDIHTFLTEERLPEGWESRVREQMGLTMFALNRTSIGVELSIEAEVEQPLHLM
ncbi:Cloroperoxidase [Lactarius akahatsu]|uniref:Cloroperoxidase n=1 Tax=Lactarius akahatsu TaxID=416441 RepID=A0AAD4LJJ2_9AGAM|nr:Cloroperoxidase [Lactarius akahatsu]